MAHKATASKVASTSQAPTVFLVEEIEVRRLLVQAQTAEESEQASQLVPGQDWIEGYSRITQSFPVSPQLYPLMVDQYDIHDKDGDLVDEFEVPITRTSLEAAKQLLGKETSPNIWKLSASTESTYIPQQYLADLDQLHVISHLTTIRTWQILAREISHLIVRVAPEARLALLAEAATADERDYPFSGRPMLYQTPQLPRNITEGAILWPEDAEPLPDALLAELEKAFGEDVWGLLVDIQTQVLTPLTTP